MGYHFGVGTPLILDLILVGVGMFTGVRAFDPWPYVPLQHQQVELVVMSSCQQPVMAKQAVEEVWAGTQ